MLSALLMLCGLRTCVTYEAASWRETLSESHRSSADATPKWCSGFLGTLGLMGLFLCPTGDMHVYYHILLNHIIFLWLSCNKTGSRKKAKTKYWRAV